MLRVPQSHFPGPSDLALRQSVLDQVCADAKVDIASVDRQVLVSPGRSSLNAVSLIGMKRWARCLGGISLPSPTRWHSAIAAMPEYCGEGPCMAGPG